MDNHAGWAWTDSKINTRQASRVEIPNKIGYVRASKVAAQRVNGPSAHDDEMDCATKVEHHPARDEKPWNHPTTACHREWFAGASLALLRVRMLNGGTDENCHCPRDDVLLLQNEAQAAEHSDDEKRTNPKQKFAFHWCPAHAARQ